MGGADDRWEQAVWSGTCTDNGAVACVETGAGDPTAPPLRLGVGRFWEGGGRLRRSRLRWQEKHISTPITKHGINTAMKTIPALSLAFIMEMGTCTLGLKQSELVKRKWILCSDS